MKKMVVIGAGPAGLTAAVELLAQGDCQVTVLEATEAMGGIARTVRHCGNRMDIGGHRFFSKSDEVMDWWLRRMPQQGAAACDDKLLGREKPLAAGGPDPEQTDRVMLVRERLSRIYFLRKFFDYPISIRPQTFLNMGLRRTVQAGAGYLCAHLRKRPERNLEDFMVNRFGWPLYRMFFEDYTRKVWGKHPSELSADWGAQRIKGVSLGKAIWSALQKPFRKAQKTDIRQKDRETSLIEQFLYPKYGPGQLWEAVAEEVKQAGGVLLKGTRATRLEFEGGRVVRVVAEGPQGPVTLDCDQVLSSMPLCDLVAACAGIDKPGEVAQVARDLPYRDFLTVGLEVRRLQLVNHTGIATVNNIIPDAWIYIQERDVKIGRLQVFNNWSPYLVREWRQNVWLGLEYFCNEQDDLYQMPAERLIEFAIGELVQLGIIRGKDDVVEAVRVAAPKAYPAYYGSYAQFGVLRAWLDRIPNLWCIGRNGQHRYNNMDHSMLSAMASARQIARGLDSKDPVWAVNAEDEYHETKSS